MQIDLRTVAIKPLRNTFDHLVERFGDVLPWNGKGPGE